MANKQDNFDYSSIIENKIQTKTYWEQKMLEVQKLNLKISGKLLVPSSNRDKKLLSDGESESLDSSLSQVDSLIDSNKLNSLDCVTESIRNKSLFTKRNDVQIEKLDQQNSDTEEELYSDCLEQFDDQIERINLKSAGENSETMNERTSEQQVKSDYPIKNQSAVESSHGNEILSVIDEEEDSSEQRSFIREQHQFENQQECIKKSGQNDEMKALDIVGLDELRVKVEGSNEQQVDCTNKVNERTNNELKFETTCNEQPKSVEQQEQVLTVDANIVKPNKQQGDQVVSVTQSAKCGDSLQQVHHNDTLKCLKENFSHEKCLELNCEHTAQPSCLSSSSQTDKLSLVKSIKSESPSIHSFIHFQQRVSVVKSTFEKKVQESIMSSNQSTNGDRPENLIFKNQQKTIALKKVDDDRLTDTENKIAREMREMREREEELRQMRLERLNKDNLLTLSCLTTNCSTSDYSKSYLSSANSTTSSTTSSAESTISLNRSDDSSLDSPPVTNDQCSTSMDSLDEGFTDYKSPNLVSKNQSTTEIHSPKAISNNSCAVSNGNTENPGEIQKILATTRIQQEIEEQTRRELALKLIGSIKTISQERTDKLSNLLGSNLGANSVLSPTLSLSSLASSLVSLSSININTNNSQSNSINQTSDLASSAASTPVHQTTNGGVSDLNGASNKLNSFKSTNQKSLATTCPSSIKARTNLYTKNTSAGLLKNRTFSTSHLNNLTSGNNSQTPSSFNLFKMNQTGRHISMARFIATKGKSAIVDHASSSSNQFNITNNVGHSDLSYSYTDLLRPPKIDLTVAHKIIEKKCLQSADYKISSELRDLYQREEELRKQRARTIGQSQPNLSLLECDDQVDNGKEKKQESENGSSPKSKNSQELITDDQSQVYNVQKFSLEGCRARPLANLLKKATSNPNLSEAQIQSKNDHQTKEQSIKSSCKEVNLCSSTRLIAQKLLKTEKIK